MAGDQDSGGGDDGVDTWHVEQLSAWRTSVMEPG
jgi:hypothetical protein